MSILLFLLSFQYITTRSHLRTIHNETVSRKLLIDYPVGALPIGVKDVLDVYYNRFHGFDLVGDSFQIWTPRLLANVICGTGFDSRWTYYPAPHYEYVQQFSIPGFFLLLGLTTLLALALTGVWPLLVSMSEDFEFLIEDAIERRREENRSNFAFNLWKKKEDLSEVDLKRRNHCRNIFKYVWLCLSLFITILFAGLASHFLCAAFNWPLVFRLSQAGKCYFLETAGLSRAQKENLDIETMQNDLPKARMERDKKNNAVDFYYNCENSVWYSEKGSTWNFNPSWKVSCEPRIAAIIADLQTNRQTRCTLGSWKGEYGGLGEPYESFEFSGKGGRCGFLNIGVEEWRAWGSFKIDEKTDWSFCHLHQHTPGVSRYDKNKIVSVPDQTKFDLTFDPYAQGREKGWYVSGDKEIINFDAEARGKRPKLILNTAGIKWKDYMKDRHIWSDGLDVRIAQPDEVIPKPVAFRCEMKARVSKADRFEEFQDPCEGVLVTPKSGGGALVFISTDVMVCTVSLGWSYDNQSNTFVLRPGESITVQGVDRWRCITKGNKGSQCTEKGGFEPLADSVLAEGNKFIVNVLGAPPNDPGNYVNLSTPKSRQPQATTDLSDVPNVVLIVVFSILTVVIIAILVRIVVWAVRRRRSGGPQRIP